MFPRKHPPRSSGEAAARPGRSSRDPLGRPKPDPRQRSATPGALLSAQGLPNFDCAAVQAIEDLEDLALRFIEESNFDECKEVDGLNSECLAALRVYSWPENVRELRNVLQQAVMTRGRGRLTVQDLPEDVFKARHREDQFLVRIGSTGKAIKREAAARTLSASTGNHRRAAGILGISPQTPYDLLHNSGLPRRRRGSNQSDDPPSS